MAIPSAPQGLTVAFEGSRAAIEGQMRWNPPTNLGDLPLLEFEVAAVEGNTFTNPTWIGTKSTGYQYLMQRLKRGTQYAFGVRGKNADGVGPVSNVVTPRTPICSLHNALFFKDCVNYFQDVQRATVHGGTTPVPEINDNKYNTFSSETDIVLNIAVNGQPTRVDAIFLKLAGSNIRHSLTPTGGQGSGYSNRAVPATVTNWEGATVSTVVPGYAGNDLIEYQHDLYLLPEHFTATSVRLQLTGTGVKLYEVMLLEFGLELDANGDFTQIEPFSNDRAGVLHPNPQGGIQRKPLGVDAREKWEVDVAAKFVPGKTMIEDSETFRQWRMRNYNHVFVQEFTRKPSRVFPASFMELRVGYLLRGRQTKLLGDVWSDRIGER